MERWNLGMLDKAYLSAQKAIFPFSLLLLLLERFYQFEKFIFNFVMELVELFVLSFRDLVGFHKSYASFILFLCSFLYLHKETNQRKCSRSLGPPKADFPVLLEFVGSLKTRFAQTV